MKAEKKTTVKIKLNAQEAKILQEVIDKLILGEAPFHDIGILNKIQLEFIKNLQKLLSNGC